MGSKFRYFAPLLLAAAIACPLFTTGCAVHARVYDPYYHDYHARAGETVYYNQWEHDTHRDHQDLEKRNKEDQKAYWDWRHSQDNHH
jgi:hypothetical protein